MKVRAHLARIIVSSSISFLTLTACSSSDSTTPPGPVRIAVDSVNHRAYVTNFNGNSVSVIDTTSNTVLTTIHVGMNPVGVAVFPSVGKAYAANNGGDVFAIDISTYKVIAKIPAVSPYGLVVNPGNSRVYVTEPRGLISIINAVNDTFAGGVGSGQSLSVPFGIGVHSGTNLIYIVNRGFNNVVVMDTSFSFGPSITVGNIPSEIAIDHTSNRAYVTNNGAPSSSPESTVSVINTTSNTVVATVTVGSAPDGVGVHTGSNKIYVANSLSNTVSVTNNTVIASIPVGVGPAGVAVDSTNNRAYVTNFDDNTVSVTNNTVIASIPVGVGPAGVAVDSTNNRAYVTNFDENTVSVIATIDI